MFRQVTLSPMLVIYQSYLTVISVQLQRIDDLILWQIRILKSETPKEFLFSGKPTTSNSYFQHPRVLKYPMPLSVAFGGAGRHVQMTRR